MPPPQHLLATMRAATSMSAVVNTQLQLALKKSRKEDRVVRDCLEIAQTFSESICNLLVESMLAITQDSSRALSDLPAEFTRALKVS